jgi:hypothetical protein
VERGWLVVVGDVVDKGSVNPAPLEPVGDVDSSRWGPRSLTSRLFPSREWFVRFIGRSVDVVGSVVTDP